MFTFLRIDSLLLQCQCVCTGTCKCSMLWLCSKAQYATRVHGTVTDTRLSFNFWPYQSHIYIVSRPIWWHCQQYWCDMWVWHCQQYWCDMWVWHCQQYWCDMWVWHCQQYWCDMWVWHCQQYWCDMWVWHWPQHHNLAAIPASCPRNLWQPQPECQVSFPGPVYVRWSHQKATTVLDSPPPPF